MPALKTISAALSYDFQPKSDDRTLILIAALDGLTLATGEASDALRVSATFQKRDGNWLSEFLAGEGMPPEAVGLLRYFPQSDDPFVYDRRAALHFQFHLSDDQVEELTALAELGRYPASIHFNFPYMGNAIKRLGPGGSPWEWNNVPDRASRTAFVPIEAIHLDVQISEPKPTECSAVLSQPAATPDSSLVDAVRKTNALLMYMFWLVLAVACGLAWRRW